jgi:hypothetical protein
MTALHTELTDARWRRLSLAEQMANVGSDIERAIKWTQKGRPDQATNAIYRGLELLELIIADPRNLSRPGGLRELTRLREVLLDYFLGPNEFGSSDAAWRRYFGAFGFAAALERERRLVS